MKALSTFINENIKYLDEIVVSSAIACYFNKGCRKKVRRVANDINNGLNSTANAIKHTPYKE